MKFRRYNLLVQTLHHFQALVRIPYFSMSERRLNIYVGNPGKRSNRTGGQWLHTPRLNKRL